MDRKEKLNILQALNEDRLRKEVLIPLFRAMGFKDVIEYHGTVEKGKDIIFYETDKFDAKIYTGVVVKKEPITGAVSDSKSAKEVLFQVEQTFDEPYTDVYGLKELVIDRCIVITSRDITNTAIESIKGRLKKSNLDKLVNFFDGHKVVDLLDTHMPGYFFNEYEAFMTYFNVMKGCKSCLSRFSHHRPESYENNFSVCSVGSIFIAGSVLYTRMETYFRRREKM